MPRRLAISLLFQPQVQSLLFLTGAFLFAYSGIFRTLAGVWWNNSVYSHGFLVPPTSMYIFWTQRHKLNGFRLEADYLSGLSVLTFGLLMHITGNAAGVIFIQEISILVSLSGVVILVAGRGFLRAFWLPIFYLFFMLRFWEFITSHLHQHFQNLTAYMAAKLLNFASIPAYRDSIYLELPNVTLEVAEVCSGVNYLIAVLALGIPLSYLTLTGNLRRVLLVSLGVGIAILANGLRVALIGALAFYGYTGPLHGPYHLLQAMFVSGVGFIALFIGAWVLKDKPGQRQDARPSCKIQNLPSFKLPAILSSALLLIAGVYINFYTPPSVPLPKSLETFPYTINKWTGVDASSTIGKLDELEVDSRLIREYVSPDGARVGLFIGYLGRQTQGREIINYRTAELEAVSSYGRIKTGGEDSIEVKRIKAGEASGLLWYDINGRALAGRLQSKLYTAWDGLKGRSNGTMIVVWWKGPGTGSLSVKAEEFAGELVPILKGYLP
ncbi:MAG: exosortase W [Deltaproteobacteria bacterium]|nr:exosortase W [Deltaproteobacteria bacterium]